MSSKGVGAWAGERIPCLAGTIMTVFLEEVALSFILKATEDFHSKM